MRKILLLCLLGLSSIGFAEVVNDKTFEQRLEAAQKYATPKQIKDIRRV